MSDLKTLEEKINHIDKTVLGIDTTVKHFAEKLAETVRINSAELSNHDNRINDLERSFHIYDGSIKTLNRLLTLCSAGILSGVIWLFMQINEIKREYAITESNYRHMVIELSELKREIDDVKNKSTKQLHSN